VPAIQQKVIKDIKESGYLDPNVIYRKEFQHKRPLVPTSTKNLLEQHAKRKSFGHPADSYINIGHSQVAPQSHESYVTPLRLRGSQRDRPSAVAEQYKK